MADISVIIPAYNEERFLPQTLESIRQHLGGLGYSYEIIVADHGSSDHTVAVARDAGVTVLELERAPSVAVLRNTAVQASRGSVLVFLDADITLTAEWAQAFPEAYRRLLREPLLITGAKTYIPQTAGWVSRLWLRRRPNESPTHLGSGHMITTRLAFELVKGFPELETGEDYEFCATARRAGIRIVAQGSLRALHHGVPENLRQYFLQQVWHGRGEWRVATAILKSRVAVATILFLVMHVAVLCGLVVGGMRGVVALAAVGVLAICLASSWAQYRGRGIWPVVGNTGLFYVYYVARVVSLASVLWRRTARKRMRAL